MRGLLAPLPVVVDLLHLEHMHVQGSIFGERLCDSVYLSGAMEIALDFSPTPPPTPFGRVDSSNLPPTHSLGFPIGTRVEVGGSRKLPVTYSARQS